MSGANEGSGSRFSRAPLIEHSVECPYCGEVIDIFIDPAEASQAYVEDCSVCCKPIHFRVTCENEDLVSVVASPS